MPPENKPSGKLAFKFVIKIDEPRMRESFILDQENFCLGFDIVVVNEANRLTWQFFDNGGM